MGYVWVPIELAETGTRLSLASPDGDLDAEVVSLPFLDPKKDIPKG